MIFVNNIILFKFTIGTKNTHGTKRTKYGKFDRFTPACFPVETMSDVKVSMLLGSFGCDLVDTQRNTANRRRVRFWKVKMAETNCIFFA